MMELRQYQVDAVDALRERIRKGRKKVPLVSPTGSGKTVTFSAIVQRAASLGSRALILAHRRELVTQASQKLIASGVEHGIIQAGFPVSLHRPVQVASVQTLARRLNVLERVDIIVVDECHHITTKNLYGQLLARWPNAIILGVTATPWRLDGVGLADVFEDFVIARTPRELRDEGFLVPVGGWEYEPIDTSEVRVRGGDFVAGELGRAAMGRKVIGDIVSEWLVHAAGRRTVLFACTIEHSQAMAQEFLKAGVPAEHVDGEMPTAQRDAVLRRLRSGETLVVTNCNVLTEGFDCPELEVAILARPTLSTSLYLQMVGRILRPADGKTVARIHDHAGCLAAHGHPYAERDYSPTSSARAPRTAKEQGSAALKRCTSCKSVIARWPCDSCGYSPTPTELKVEYEEAARKREIQADGSAPKSKTETDAERREKWRRRYEWDNDGEMRKEFFLRMVAKHGPSKGAWVFRWVSGHSDRPRPEWTRLAQEARAS